MTWYLDYLNYHQWGITDNHAEAHYLGDRLPVEEQALKLTDDEVADFRRVEAEYEAWQGRLSGFADGFNDLWRRTYGRDSPGWKEPE